MGFVSELPTDYREQSWCLPRQWQVHFAHVLHLVLLRASPLGFPLESNASNVQRAALFSSKASGGFLSLAVCVSKAGM